MPLKAEIRRSFITTTVREGHTRCRPGLRARTVNLVSAMLGFLSDEITCEIFRGAVLKGRLVSKDILRKLWSAGSVNRPIFFRPAVAFTQPTSNDLAFLSRFSFARLLVPYEADSQEARELVMAARDFSIIAVQEITVADVRKAASAGFEETCSLIDKIVTSNIPVPSLSVLQHILDHIRHVVSIKEDFEPLWYMGAQLCVRD